MNEKDLILLRGLPGSGKTTLARVLADGSWPVFGIDDYFTAADGTYTFRHLENHLAYSSCQERTRDAMKQGLRKIYIDNTFTMEWEMEPYFQLAAEYGYRIFVITVENRHGGNNTHSISRDQLERMAAKYKVQLLPPDTPVQPADPSP